ncbi:MAG TPA: hypothetical protein V6D47_10875 [Oscillatoriaceae cyanobacterium]
MRARHGGALLPVLILAIILFLLSAMLPQVLVAASSAMRHDQGRETLLAAAESGVAFAEARLKDNITDALTLGQAPNLAPFDCKPTMENPDYGDGHRATFDVAVTDIEALPPVEASDPTSADASSGVPDEVDAFHYQLISHASSDQGQGLSVQVSGIMAFTVHVDHGDSGGVAVKTVTKVEISPLDAEFRDGESAPVGSGAAE